MKIDTLVAEIGSTITVVNAFDSLDTDAPRFVGQGFYRTTVLEGDVRIGLEGAVKDLKKQLGADDLVWNSFFSTSSAAGGLKMTVHGLVYDMTVRAAKEAALGAGANLLQVTAGKMRESDTRKLISINPNIILIAGGVDYGERDTALYNAGLICKTLKEEKLITPVIYAGNIENREEIRGIFSNYQGKLSITENVYPKIDELVVRPVRELIQELFEEHIIHAPGMEHIREMVNGPIVPTPGGVMLSAQLLKEEIGDLLVFDVGGATTDVHSVTEGSEAVNRILTSVQPEAKRTVEGDLGVYINRRNILDGESLKHAAKSLAMNEERLSMIIENLGVIPETEEELQVVTVLTSAALKTALKRHAGIYRDLYGERGRTRIAEGKDLTAVKFCIGTGGALTRTGSGIEVMKSVLKNKEGKNLFPSENTLCLLDNFYIMASMGVLSKKYPGAALQLLMKSLMMKGES